MLWDYVEFCLVLAREYPDIRVKIFTNGVAPVENLFSLAKYLCKLDNVEVHLPLHGDRALHSLIVRDSVHFDLVRKVIRLFRAHAAENICVNTVVTRYLCSYEMLRRVLRLCEELKVKQVSLLRLVPHGRARINMWLCPGITDYAKFYEALKLIDDEGCYDLTIRLGCPIAPRKLTLRSSIFKLTHQCVSGEKHICILPDGAIIPCVAFKGLADKYQLGDAESFENLNADWFVEEKKRTRGCWYCFAQYLYYNGLDLAKIGEEFAIRSGL